MNKRLSFWNKKHAKYASEDWIDKPSIFAQWAVQFFPNKGKVLELGAGHGQDTRFFAQKGYSVVSTDFSDVACKYNKEKLPVEIKSKVAIQILDLSAKFPFGDNFFDVAYSHLGIHFFSDKITNQLFSEIYRVLKPGGLVAILANSTKDPEYGSGKKLGKDYFELSPGDRKHFFSLNYMKDKAKNFEIIQLDDKGTSYKDTAKGVFNLIRFVGSKLAADLAF